PAIRPELEDVQRRARRSHASPLPLEPRVEPLEHQLLVAPTEARRVVEPRSDRELVATGDALVTAHRPHQEAPTRPGVLQFSVIADHTALVDVEPTAHEERGDSVGHDARQVSARSPPPPELDVIAAIA